jgi:THO complex subunit 4
VKKYNNVQLDGKPMKIEILGTNTPTAAAALPANNGGYVRNVAKRYVRIATLSFICLYAKVLHDCSSLL